MIDALKRKLGFAQAPAEAVINEGVVEMTNEVIDGAVQAAVIAPVVEAVADVAGLQTTVNSLVEQLTAANEKIAELTALVDAATEFKAAQEKAAAEAVTAGRIAALTALVGTEQATTLQAATASLDQGAFDAMVTAMSFRQKAEAATPAFTEVGAEGSTDQAKLTAEVYGGKTNDYLQNLIKTNQLN